MLKHATHVQTYLITTLQCGLLNWSDICWQCLFFEIMSSDQMKVLLTRARARSTLRLMNRMSAKQRSYECSIDPVKRTIQDECNHPNAIFIGTIGYLNDNVDVVDNSYQCQLCWLVFEK